MIPQKYKDIVAAKGKKMWLERESNVASFLAILAELKMNPKMMRILDAGCAQGRDSAQIAAADAQVTGLDMNPQFIAEARQEHPGIKFVEGRIESLPFGSGSFDAVYCVNTLFYTDYKQSLAQLTSVIKPGGVLFITLDESIFDLEKKQQIHSLDVDAALKSMTNCAVISKTYKERVDEVPFRHIHKFFEIALIKNIT